MKLDEIGIAAAKELGLRFTLVGVLPVAALVLYVAAPFISMVVGGSPDLPALAKFTHGLIAADALVLIGSIVVLAFLLQPLQLSLVRLLEGYWGGSRLARASRRFAMDGVVATLIPTMHVRRERNDRNGHRRRHRGSRGDDRDSAAAA